jgi:hypothetical protein
MIRAYYTYTYIGFVLLLLLEMGDWSLVSGLPIHAKFSQAFAKTACKIS